MDRVEKLKRMFIQNKLVDLFERVQTTHPLSLVITSISAIFGSLLLALVGWLTWFDITVWNKDLSLIFFGSRSGEAISLGIGMRVIHYFALGLVLIIPYSIEPLHFLGLKLKGDASKIDFEMKDYQKKQPKQSILMGIKSLFNRKKTVDKSKVIIPNVGDSGLKESTFNNAEQRTEVELPNKAKTIETYWLTEPFSSAKIVKHPIKGNITYIVEEPQLDSDETLALDRLKQILNETIDLKPSDMKSKQVAETYLQELTVKILNRYRFDLSPESREKLLYYIVRDNLGFGKIDPLMHDPLIEDISCDGVNVPLYIWHRTYESIPTTIKFENAEELDLLALRLAYMCGSHLSIAQPLLDATLPNGSRINLTFGSDVTRKGSTFTIRKFKLDPFTITDLIAFQSLSKEMAAYLWFAVENRISILVAGGIAAGKTTMLNCLSMFIKPDLKVVSIEDTPELNLPHENWIPAATRTVFTKASESVEITLFDLLKASLRQRPDYIIVGEIRGAEAYTLFQAVSTGHLGMSTIHAESVEAAIYRLESSPMNIPRTLIAGIDIILVQKKVELKGKPARKTVTASEIVGLDPRSGEILINEVYHWSPLEDKFSFTGRSYIMERIAEQKGITIEEAEEEIQRRADVIDWMNKNNIRNYREVSDIIRSYSQNPEYFMREVMKNE